MQSQIKKARLAHNWRRRSNNDAQLANARAETFALVAQALQQADQEGSQEGKGHQSQEGGQARARAYTKTSSRHLWRGVYCEAL
jgi:hypothetical protein